MFSIFKEALKNASDAPAQSTVILDYSYYDEEENTEEIAPENKIFCTEIILHYKGGTEELLPIPALIKIVSLPELNHNTKVYYSNINAVDSQYIMQGYNHVIQLESDTIIKNDEIEAIEVFQDKTEGLLRIVLSGDPVVLFEEVQAATDAEAGKFFKQTTFITKEKLVEMTYEQ